MVVILWAYLYRTGLSSEQFSIFIYVLPFLHLGIPTLYGIYAGKKGLIHDIDVSNRKERYGIMSVIFAKNIISLIVIYFYGTVLMFEYMLVMAIAYAATYFITFFWKISMHMTLSMMGLMLFNSVTNWQYEWTFFIIPFIMWARLTLHKHTPAQLVAGVAIPGTILIGGFYFFGIL